MRHLGSLHFLPREMDKGAPAGSELSKESGNPGVPGAPPTMPSFLKKGSDLAIGSFARKLGP